MQCDQLRDDRLDVLYGEGDAAARRRVEEHLAACESCREEMAGLRSLRQDLRTWRLPVTRAAFRAPRRGGRWLPLAAGFLLAVGAGLLLAGTELRYEQGVFALRLGPTDAPLREALREHEARALAREEAHRRELAALRASLPEAPRGEGDLLARVAEMLKESEARQGARLETTLARYDQQQSAQRRYDMARIAAGLSYLDGKNGQHVARTTELMGYVLQASAPEN